MKTTLSTLLVLTLLGSCVTEKKRLKICQNCPTKTETIVRDSIVQKDSIIVLPGEIITEYIRIDCPDGAKPTVTTKSKSGKKGRLETKLIDPNTIKADCVIDSASVALSWNESHKVVTTVQTLPSPEVCYTGWDMILSTLGSIGLISLIGLGIYYRDKKRR
jgi:hypothetical protein